MTRQMSMQLTQFLLLSYISLFACVCVFNVVAKIHVLLDCFHVTCFLFVSFLTATRTVWNRVDIYCFNFLQLTRWQTNVTHPMVLPKTVMSLGSHKTLSRIRA
uniref:Uncharacterized protein n=1 Tax=Opuntia streptacantha TaxID=393608 RepID=A0A7C9CUH4_OPUST